MSKREVSNKGFNETPSIPRSQRDNVMIAMKTLHKNFSIVNQQMNDLNTLQQKGLAVVKQHCINDTNDKIKALNDEYNTLLSTIKNQQEQSFVELKNSLENIAREQLDQKTVFQKALKDLKTQQTKKFNSMMSAVEQKFEDVLANQRETYALLELATTSADETSNEPVNVEEDRNEILNDIEEFTTKE